MRCHLVKIASRPSSSGVKMPAHQTSSSKDRYRAAAVGQAPGDTKSEKRISVAAEGSMVLMRNAGETAEAFYRSVQTRPTVFRKYGFVLPGDASAEERSHD
jgi:hypothetical protein